MKGRIKMFCSLTVAIVICIVVFRFSSTALAAEKNILAISLLPQIVASVDGLHWSCIAGPNQLGSEVGFVSNRNNPSLLIGQQAAAEGDCATALQNWQVTADTNGLEARLAHFELGRGLYSLGDLSGAIKQFQLSDAANHIHGLAMSHQKANEPTEARTLFELAFSVKPNLATAEQLARIYGDAGGNERVIKMWQQLADSTNNEDVVHWLALTETAVQKQDWVQADDALEQALGVTNDPYQIYLRLGRVRVKQTDWIGVIEAYQRAIELNPDASSEPYSQAGLAAAQLGHYNEAMEWFDLGVIAVPLDPWPNIHAGNVAEQHGDLLKAEEYFRAAVAVAPDHFGALYALGAFLIRHERPEESIRILEKLDYKNNCVVAKLLNQAYSALNDLVRNEEIIQYVKQTCP